jgi:hypothetical protein
LPLKISFWLVVALLQPLPLSTLLLPAVVVGVDWAVAAVRVGIERQLVLLLPQALRLPLLSVLALPQTLGVVTPATGTTAITLFFQVSHQLVAAVAVAHTTLRLMLPLAVLAAVRIAERAT